MRTPSLLIENSLPISHAWAFSAVLFKCADTEFGLDEVRTAARRQAWYSNEDDETPNYNPFQRIRRHRNGNEEYDGIKPLQRAKDLAAYPELRKLQATLGASSARLSVAELYPLPQPQKGEAHHLLDGNKLIPD